MSEISFHFISFLLINPNLQFYFLTAHKKAKMVAKVSLGGQCPYKKRLRTPLRIVIYPVDSATQRLNNRGQKGKF